MYVVNLTQKSYLHHVGQWKINRRQELPFGITLQSRNSYTQCLPNFLHGFKTSSCWIHSGSFSSTEDLYFLPNRRFVNRKARGIVNPKCFTIIYYTTPTCLVNFQLPIEFAKSRRSRALVFSWARAPTVSAICRLLGFMDSTSVKVNRSKHLQ